MAAPSPTRCPICGTPVLGDVHLARVGDGWTPTKPPERCRKADEQQ